MSQNLPMFLKGYNLCAVVLFLLPVCSGLSGAPGTSTDELRKQSKSEFQFAEISADQMDVTELTETGRRCLQSGLVNWQHAQSAHFVLHYERKDFARHVAGLAEFLYAYMAEELHVSGDRLKGRSHIFIFNSERRWKAFSNVIAVPGEWAFSFVRGPDMFLQRAGARHESGDIVAHEMVHIILYRFYGKEPPLWLNEGLAQWYQEFGYSAFKGSWKSRKAPFTALKAWYPLREMAALTTYPNNGKDLVLYYRTSKYLVGYLMLEQPPDKMHEFVATLTDGVSLEKALCDIYRIGDIKYLERDFERFVR